MLKYETLTSEQKNKLKELIGHCEKCGSKENLTIHRINRGWNCGAYTLRNVYILCYRCHKLIHYKEEGCK